MPEDLSRISAVKLALAARRLRDREGIEVLDAEPIAVTGMSCRFPGGANNPLLFWRLLEVGQDAISEVPASRWDVAKSYDPDPAAPGRMVTRHGGFLDRIDGFDCEFFGITPREAACMDPQQRLLLEVVWEALEDGGHATDDLAGSRSGVFVGISTADYANLQFSHPESIDAYASTGNAHSIVANRISYVLDLRGPSLAIDTACSSSLVAVHLACRSLRTMECDLAIAGGVNLILSPGWTISFSKFGMMSPDGRCKTFDARANGFVRGEGIGAVTLRRLSDAIADGDPILALIRGSAVNQDGQSNGLTAPNLLAQQAVIRQALAAAHVPASLISYVETHGTGTALGDPIEVSALAEVIGAAESTAKQCALGSVKTNIGHLEAAAGIAGLIKVVLALRHAAIPRNLHFERLNPHIRLQGTRFTIPTETQPWVANGSSRFAAISSFGFGGTNAHVVLEEAPIYSGSPSAAASEAAGRLLPLSAKSPASLRQSAREFCALLKDASISVDDVCFTASAKRRHHPYRLSIVGSSREQMIERLLSRAIDREFRPAAGLPRVAFIYSGQGANWHGAGQDLLQEKSFRDALQECDALIRSLAGWSVIEEITAAPDRNHLGDGRYAQPALFCFQVALTAQWRHWGIEPEAVAGHSVGEAAAAYGSGALSLEDATRVVLERSRLMQAAAGRGAMASIDMSAAEADQLVAAFPGALWVAVINSPTSVVLAGEHTALNEALRLLDERKVFARRLPVDFAFHTPQMEPFRQPLVGALAAIRPRKASISIASSALASRLSGNEFDADYWGANLRQPVRFAQAIEILLAEDIDHFVEIAPRPVLQRALRQCVEGKRSNALITSSLRNGVPERDSMLEALGALYEAGCSPDWHVLHGGRGRVVSLPAYPWNRESHWFVPHTPEVRYQPASTDEHPVLGRRVEIAHLPNEHVWEMEMSSDRLAFLRDHRIRGVAVLPAASYIELALAAGAAVFGERDIEISELDLHKTLVLPANEARRLQVRLTAGASDAGIQIHSRTAASADWTLHAAARISFKQRGERSVAS